ncbi:MAG: hypothetical protein GXO76_15555 [Calditrichaeota bacterium]|nr:hypothetical protein [Calditrichota bacterium]
MKRIISTTGITALVMAIGLFFAVDTQLMAQTENPDPTPNPAPNQGTIHHGHRFVDLNGDGINDNAPDADGDGIPNGQDPDYTGSKARMGHGARGFIDENGDGINDWAQDFDNDGIPNGQDPDWVRPMDGTGRMMGAKGHFGHGNRGKMGHGNGMQAGLNQNGTGTAAGTCDGTGPKGLRGQRAQHP